MNTPKSLENLKSVCQDFAIALTPQALIVSIKDQRMLFIENEATVRDYVISTSRRPPSCVENSLGTPLGLHFITDKIGSDVPPGGVLKGRVYTGQHFSEFPAEEQKKNLITSRILRLRGLEPGKNTGEGCDTFDRYVYIHGTNRESFIGTPQSHGCVLMKNTEIIELFDQIQEKALVWIY